MDRELDGSLLTTAYVVVAVLAVSLGICAGSIASSTRANNVLDGQAHLVSVAAATKDSVSNENNVDADLRSPLSYVPIGFRKIDGSCFAVLAEHLHTIQTSGNTVANNFAEIFDHEGRLRRRYVAVEQADSSWQLTEYLRLPAHFARQLLSCQ